MTQSLLTRLNSLEGPCRECDAMIANAYFPSSLRITRLHDIPKYTSSLDAIAGLIERDLPGWCRSLDHAPNRGYRTHMFNPDDPTSHGFASQHKLEAVAYCLTYVNAKKATRNASEVK